MKEVEEEMITIKEKKESIVTEEGRSASGRKEGRKGSLKEGGFTAGSQVVAGHGRTISTWRPVPPRWSSSLSSGAYARDILLSRLPLLRRRRGLLLLLLQGFVTRARKGRGREPKPNETKHGSLLFAPPPPARSVVHAHARTRNICTRAYTCTRVCTRIYIYTHVNASTRSFPLARTRASSLRSVPPSLVLPFSSLLASSSANDRAKSVDVLF